jgi:predicted nuclease of restriction endonuclease-like (RecB) superfamily
MSERAPYGEQIVDALSRQLSWTQLRQIFYLDNPTQREFYAHMCRAEPLSTPTMENKAQEFLYERAVIRRKPRHLVRKGESALLNEERVNSLNLIFLRYGA